ncbi:hypothetical protein F4780DRAFT_290562 [Xylariomycetidae sp. FL0641]|nr:hypothetical protein F4780DRAFT_290562 [Xylariomycetidae sp. FL0641]
MDHYRNGKTRKMRVPLPAWSCMYTNGTPPNAFLIGYGVQGWHSSFPGKKGKEGAQGRVIMLLLLLFFKFHVFLYLSFSSRVNVTQQQEDARHRGRRNGRHSTASCVCVWFAMTRWPGDSQQNRARDEGVLNACEIGK